MEPTINKNDTIDDINKKMKQLETEADKMNYYIKISPEEEKDLEEEFKKELSS